MSKGFYTPEEWKAVGWAKLEEAADHVLTWITAAGVKGLRAEIVADREQDLTPAILVEIDGDLPETYFFYGHFDKQPPFVGWNEGLGPYAPVLHPSAGNPEKLYGRGGADDGYSSYGSILAVKALQAQGVPIPSKLWPTQGATDYERLWITTSLRGYAIATVRIDVLNEGVHSGSASGLVPSSFRILRQLIERLENQETGVMAE
ncbi:uncharacterized protein LOC116268200 [Nymphaea colorata]|uniref:uncharacterized protein LOC116268200 n=1 Tax=Nymphaea colorata TaxID=210225 RepID=UPI00129ECCF4|nr:uncharacterized protein LOC116268200 [Nymphaea colorata]